MSMKIVSSKTKERPYYFFLQRAYNNVSTCTAICCMCGMSPKIVDSLPSIIFQFFWCQIHVKFENLNLLTDTRYLCASFGAQSSAHTFVKQTIEAQIVLTGRNRKTGKDSSAIPGTQNT